MSRHGLKRWGVVGVLAIATCAHAVPATTPATSPTSPSSPTSLPTSLPTTAPTVDAQLQAAARPLVDFAIWCAANKARSNGESAIDLAKKVVDAPDRADQAIFALRVAADDSADTADVTKQQLAAMAESMAVLQAMADQAHQAGDDALSDNCLIKASRFSPHAYVEALGAAADRALLTNRAVSAENLYGVLMNYDQPLALESKLAAKSLLPASAAKAVSEMIAGGQPLTAMAYLGRISRRDPKNFSANKYQPCVDLLAARPMLARIPTHAMVAYISVPWKWSPMKVSPVIFCFAGAGKEYKTLCDNYHSVIGDGPFIVVSAVTFSNTNGVNEDGFRAWYPASVVHPYVSGGLNANTIAQRLQFDQPGVLAMFKAVHDAANTEDQMYITGFSGGGMPCYATMISTPNLVAAAAPACANYYLALPPRGAAKGTSVQQFFGEKDGFNAAIGKGAGLIAQGHEAATVLGQMGYTVAEPVMVPNMGHNAMAKSVVEFFNTARAANQKEIK